MKVKKQNIQIELEQKVTEETEIFLSQFPKVLVALVADGHSTNLPPLTSHLALAPKAIAKAGSLQSRPE